MRRRSLLLGAAGAPLSGPGRADSETFPQRPVRLVVPYSVGVGPDVVARSVAAHLQQHWRQTVWVDNKPGASGIVAFGEVRRTPADGHTLFLADTATLAVNPLLHERLPYDVEHDLAPLSLLFRVTFLIWTGGGSRHATLAALLEAARHAPGRVSYASLGHGHASQVAVETRQRLAALPQVPTLPEAGGPPVEMHPWAALVGVAGTPPAVLAQLVRDITQALAAPEVRQRAEQAGFEVTPSTPQALRERVRADVALVQPLVAEGRIVRL